MTTKVGLYREKRNKSRPWIVRWFGEYDPITGRQKHYSEAFATKREAEALQAAKQAELNRGSPRDRPDDINIGEFAHRFLETKGKAQRPETRRAYRITLEQLAAFAGANTPMRFLNKELCDRFIATRGRVAKHGKGYKPASRNRHLRHCKAAMQVAVEWGYLPANPFARIKQERITGRKWHHLKPTEFQAIVAAVTDLRWRAFYFLAYTTGARFGELFNLTWTDVDFERCTVVIRDRQAATDTPPFHVKDHETRTLLLPGPAVDALLAWHGKAPEKVPYILVTEERWRRLRERWHLCRDHKPWKLDQKTGSLVWIDWENRYMVNNVARTIRSHARRAGVKATAPLNIHTFRKSFAQNHANAGTPIHVLQRLMGHASITTTREFYLQQSDENEKAAVRRYESLLADKTCVRLAYKGGKRRSKAPASATSESQLPSESTT